MLELTQTDAGILLPVHAQPGARRNALVGTHDGRLKVSVTTAPEQGKANKHLTQVLAAELGLKRSSLSLQSGEHSSRKVFLVQTVTVAELRQRIETALAE